MKRGQIVQEAGLVLVAAALVGFVLDFIAPVPASYVMHWWMLLTGGLCYAAGTYISR